MEDKEEESNEHAYLVGSWQLNDILFLTPSSNSDTLQMMENGKASILQQVVKMSFKADNSVVENVNGQIRNGTWEVKNDSIVNITFDGEAGNSPMVLRNYDETKLQFVIGTVRDQSLYTFKKVE